MNSTVDDLGDDYVHLVCALSTLALSARERLIESVVQVRRAWTSGTRNECRDTEECVHAYLKGSNTLVTIDRRFPRRVAL